MTKVFVATPAYAGKVHVAYAISLSETVNFLMKHNIQVQIQISTSGSLLCAERNRLVEMFMDTDCTHMLCIDSDLGWPKEAVLGLLNHHQDFVCGVYPSRKGKEFFFRPTINDDGSIVKNDQGLLEMEYIPAGFMLLTRECIKKMRDFHPELYFTPKKNASNSISGYALFNTEVYEGEFWGEDYVFCRHAREAGIKIFVDPYIEFDHDGERAMLIEVLTDDPDKALKQ